MEQTTSPAINPGVTICTEEGSAAEQKIINLVQTALSENRSCIYNICIDGDFTVYDVPKAVSLRDALGLGAEEPFYGWQDYDKITLVEVDKANLSQENPVPKHIDLLKETKQAVLDTRKALAKSADYCMNRGRGTLLISMVTDGGKFHYDYVIMKAA